MLPFATPFLFDHSVQELGDGTYELSLPPSNEVIGMALARTDGNLAEENWALAKDLYGRLVGQQVRYEAIQGLKKQEYYEFASRPNILYLSNCFVRKNAEIPIGDLGDHAIECQSMRQCIGNKMEQVAIRFSTRTLGSATRCWEVVRHDFKLSGTGQLEFDWNVDWGGDPPTTLSAVATWIADRPEPWIVYEATNLSR